MDTKWKNNSKTRWVVTLITLFAVTVMNLCFYSLIYSQADIYKENLDETVLERLYHGCYVLYLEQKEQEAGQSLEADDLFFIEEKEESLGDRYDYERADSEIGQNEINTYLSTWREKFERYRSAIDYYMTDGTMERKNTNAKIEEIIKENPEQQILADLQSYYKYYIALTFDENGVFQVTSVYANTETGNIEGDLLREFDQIDRNKSLQKLIAAYAKSYEIGAAADRIRSFQVVYGITSDAVEQISLYEGYSYDSYLLISERAIWLYLMSIGILALAAAMMTSRKIWPDIISYNRKGRRYVMEAACIGVGLIFTFFSLICSLIKDFGEEVVSLRYFAVNGTIEMAGCLFWIMADTFLVYAVAYASILALRPLFSLGLKKYIKQYSFFYQIFPWIKKKGKHLATEVNHIDFSERSTRTLMKISILNFFVLAMLMCLQESRFFCLIIYSVLLFFLIKKFFDKIARDYQILMKATSRIAEGDLDTIITEDIGVFEPLKGELFKIRTGFKKAVGEETKSQRMKTDLITNVSHDLKTPLTAITTYVELLKKADITSEEQRSYIDILDRKVLRLKVLIEDLFEISKASSNNIVLDMMEVDLVNLMKQVSIEHTDQYRAEGIELRWNVPEDKVILMLDNQKTYRIFENLFVNIQKYAMPGSRVYIDVGKENGRVHIVMKNMSAFELNVRPEELTERFVRGDASRNTEGSGLGLAIAKSFTEVQKGSFEVIVDGDLFKVIIIW